MCVCVYVCVRACVRVCDSVHHCVCHCVYDCVHACVLTRRGLARARQNSPRGHDPLSSLVHDLKTDERRENVSLVQILLADALCQCIYRPRLASGHL